MADAQNLFDQREAVPQETEDEIRELRERAQRAEAELARVRQSETQAGDAREERSLADANQPDQGHSMAAQEHSTAENELRKDSMMAHLLDSLQSGQNIGHYGRLVFAMVARNFFADEELVRWLTLDPDFEEAEAMNLVRQVEGRDYNPPKRERILEWQAQQEFPIIPNVDDPDSGNLYRNLKFPDFIYANIEEYQKKKAVAEK